MSEHFERQIELAYRALRRSPNTIKIYFLRSDRFLSAEQSLQIINEYGFSLRDFMLLLFSHNFQTEEKKLIDLLQKQQIERDRSVLCNTGAPE
jgi:hypothetical protein